MSKPIARLRPARARQRLGREHTARRSGQRGHWARGSAPRSVSPPEDCIKRSSALGSASLQALDVLAQARRQVGVGDRRLAAGEKSDLAHRLVRADDVLEAHLARERREARLVARVRDGRGASRSRPIGHPARARAHERSARAAADRAPRAARPWRSGGPRPRSPGACSRGGFVDLELEERGTLLGPDVEDAGESLGATAPSAPRAARAAHWSRPSCRAEPSRRAPPRPCPPRAARAAPRSRAPGHRPRRAACRSRVRRRASGRCSR